MNYNEDLERSHFQGPLLFPFPEYFLPFVSLFLTKLFTLILIPKVAFIFSLFSQDKGDCVGAWI